MKKTIIALLALGGIAMGADVGSSTFSGSNDYEAGTRYGKLTLTEDMTTGSNTNSLSSITFSPAVDIISSNSVDNRYFAGDYTVSLWVETASLSSDQVLFGYCGSWSANDTGYNGVTWDADSQALTIGRGQWVSASNTFTYLGSGNSSTTGSLSSYLSTGTGLTNITLAVKVTDTSWGHQRADVWVNGTKVQQLASYYGDMKTTTANWKGVQYFVENGTKYGTISITNEYLTTAEGIASLAGATIPEPTTATLSLLALAGLAARRRRK